jgi:mitochondrial fission protein ELM1
LYFGYRKPVYVIGAELCTWKFADFQKSLRERGVVRPFTGKEDVSCQFSAEENYLTAAVLNLILASCFSLNVQYGSQVSSFSS